MNKMTPLIFIGICFYFIAYKGFSFASTDETTNVTTSKNETYDIEIVVPVEQADAKMDERYISDTPASKLPQYIGNLLQSDRGSSMKRGTLQVAVFYDGSGSPTLSFHCDQPNEKNIPMTISEIPRSGQVTHEKEIATAEFSLGGCLLNSRVTIEGAHPDGGIDGLAFGVFVKDQQGRYCMYRSRNPKTQMRPSFVGTWPLWLSDKSFNMQVDAEMDSHGRKQVQVAISGAEYLQNGSYNMPICQYME